MMRTKVSVRIICHLSSGGALLALAALLLCSPPSSAAPSGQPTAEQQREVDRLDAEYRAHMQRLDFPSAIPEAQKLWALKQKIYGADSEDAERYKATLASTFDLGGRATQALELYQQLAESAAKRRGADSRQAAEVLQQMESVLNKLQRWDELEATYKHVLAIKKKLDGENSVQYAAELRSYAGFLGARNQFAAAQLVSEQQIKILEQIAGGRPDPGLAAALVTLGQTAWLNQQQDKAIAAFNRGLAMMERVPGLPVISLCGTLFPIASTYRLGGRIDLATPLEKRARDLYTQEIARIEKTKPDDVMLSALIGQLGLLQMSSEDLAGAEQTLTHGIELDRKYGRSSSWTAMLAQIKRAQGKPKEALALLEQAVADYAKTSAVKGVYSSMLGDLYTDLGDYKRAQTELEFDLNRIATSQGKRAPIYGVGLIRLALLDMRRKSPADAERRLGEGLDVAELDLQNTLKVGTESDHRTWFARNGYQLDLALNFHVDFAPQSASAARFALTTLLRRKGRVLDMAAANLATIRAKLSPADQQLLDELAVARGRLAKLKVAGPANGGDSFAKDVATLEGRIQELELKLSQKSSEYRAINLPIELAAIQKLIPESTKLVEIVNYQPADFTQKYSLKPIMPPRRYLAYIVGHTGDPVFVELGSADAIDQAVTALRKALANPKNDRVIEWSRALDALTFAKIEPKLDGTSDILVAPDGMLNLVPFAALVDDKQEFLIKRFTFTYLTSGRDLLRLNIKTKPQGGGVIFADPTFDASTPTSDDKATSRGQRSVDLSSISWPQLPGTRQEAQEVVKTMKKFKLYAGEQATESQLKQLHGPRILHLATHGFFLRDKPRTPSRGLELPDALLAPPPPTENPLLRSGLVLAGANQLGSGGEDGILTSLEATGLDLWGTKLVVLSACQTGDGKVTNGDGVYGLRRALVIAGAEGLIMTLWQVDDFATRDLMVGFYRELHKGRARSSALRDIQLELLAQPKYAHPYFWASFVPAGENAPVKD